MYTAKHERGRAERDTPLTGISDVATVWRDSRALATAPRASDAKTKRKLKAIDIREWREAEYPSDRGRLFFALAISFLRGARWLFLCLALLQGRCNKRTQFRKPSSAYPP